MVIRPMGKLLLLPDHKMDQDIQVVSEILAKFTLLTWFLMKMKISNNKVL